MIRYPVIRVLIVRPGIDCELAQEPLQSGLFTGWEFGQDRECGGWKVKRLARELLVDLTDVWYPSGLPQSV
jgi:hypothetical protein